MIIVAWLQELFSFAGINTDLLQQKVFFQDTVFHNRDVYIVLAKKTVSLFGHMIELAWPTFPSI